MNKIINREYFGLCSKSNKPIVCIQGLGFVGSVMALAVASSLNKKGKNNFDVIGIDLNNKIGNQKINAINSGKFPSKTNDKTIIDTFKKIKKRKNLVATNNSKSLKLAEIIIVDINLDLASKKNTTTIDFANFEEAISTIGENMNPNALILIETTVPPGTCQNKVKPILELELKKRGISNKNILIAHSYERVMPGEYYLDSIKNYWRTYSAESVEAEIKCENFLKKIINTRKYPLKKVSDTKTSEMAKILENSYRATNIALIDEWSSLAEKMGVNFFEVIDSIKVRPTHKNIMKPGLGVGGYCLTKDPLFAKIAVNEFFPHIKNLSFPFIDLTIETNKNMPIRNYNRIKKLIGNNLKNKKILILGVAYRQDVDDTRHSAVFTLYKKLLSSGANLTCHDPMVKFWKEANLEIDNKLPNSSNFDMIIFTVPHSYYIKMNIESWLGNNRSVIYDCDNVLSEDLINKLKIKGLKLQSTGRGN